MDGIIIAAVAFTICGYMCCAIPEFVRNWKRADETLCTAERILSEHECIDA